MPIGQKFVLSSVGACGHQDLGPMPTRVCSDIKDEHGAVENVGRQRPSLTMQHDQACCLLKSSTPSSIPLFVAIHLPRL